MSTATLRTRLSVEDFLERPERLDGYYEELIEGEVYVSPNVKKRHIEVVHRLMDRLRPLRTQGFLVLGEVACRITDDSLPNTDVAVVVRERWDAVDADDLSANHLP